MIWAILILFFGFISSFVTYRVIRNGVKDEFPKAEYLYNFNKWEGDVQSFKKEYLDKKMIKRVFTLESIGTTLLTTFAAILALTVLAYGFDFILSLLIRSDHPVIQKMIKFHTLENIIFLLFISFITKWIVLESHFEDIIEEIDLIEHKKILKVLKEKYNIQPPLPSWEID